MQNEQHDDEDTRNLKVAFQTSTEAAIIDVMEGVGTSMRSLGLTSRDAFGIMSASLSKSLFNLCEAGLVKKDETMDIRLLDSVLRLSVHTIHVTARDKYPELMDAITKAAQSSVPSDVINVFKAKINGGLN